MSLFLLDTSLRAYWIRGHIPGHEDFPNGPDKSSFADGGGLMRLLGIIAAIVAVPLIMWAAVWLAIKVL